MSNQDRSMRMSENSNVLKIGICGYDVKTVEESLSKIIGQVTKMGLSFSGPIYLPVKKEFITVLRSPHKHKDAREQFERRMHKRCIYILGISKSHSSYFSDLQIPHSVEITVKSTFKNS